MCMGWIGYGYISDHYYQIYHYQHNNHLNLWHGDPLGDRGNGDFQLGNGVSQIFYFAFNLAPFLKNASSLIHLPIKIIQDDRNQNQLLGDNVDLFLAFTSEGGVAQKQHHRVNVVSHPGALDLEVPLRQDILTHEFAQLTETLTSKVYFSWRPIANDDWLELDLEGLHPLLVLIVQSCSQVPTILGEAMLKSFTGKLWKPTLSSFLEISFSSFTFCSRNRPTFDLLFAPLKIRST